MSSLSFWSLVRSAVTVLSQPCSDTSGLVQNTGSRKRLARLALLCFAALALFQSGPSGLAQFNYGQTFPTRVTNQTPIITVTAIPSTVQVGQRYDVKVHVDYPPAINQQKGFGSGPNSPAGNQLLSLINFTLTTPDGTYTAQNDVNETGAFLHLTATTAGVIPLMVTTSTPSSNTTSFVPGSSVGFLTVTSSSSPALLTPSISVASGGNAIVSGSSATFTATVTGSGSQPSGTAYFFDNMIGAPVYLGSAPVNSGTAVFTSSTLAVGVHSISAVYGGGTVYASASTASNAIQAVNPSSTGPTPTILQVSASPNPATPDQAVTFTFSLTPGATGAHTPSGSIHYYLGNPSTTNLLLSGDAPLVNGVATVTVPANTMSISNAVSEPFGTYNEMGAYYVGDAYFAASNLVNYAYDEIVRSKTTCALSLSTGPIPTNTFYTYTLLEDVSAPSVSSSFANIQTPAGAINLLSGEFPDGLLDNLYPSTTSTTDLSKTISSFLAGGESYDLHFEFSEYGPSGPEIVWPALERDYFTNCSSNTLHITTPTGSQPSSVSVTASASSITTQQTTTLSATVTGTTALQPNGRVFFTDTSGATPVVLGIVSIPYTSGAVNASVTVTLNVALAAGAHSISVRYTGDSSYSTSSTSTSITVTTGTALPAPSITSYAPLSPALAPLKSVTNLPASIGSSYSYFGNNTLGGYVIATGSATPTGTLTFLDGFTQQQFNGSPIVLGTCTLAPVVSATLGSVPGHARCENNTIPPFARGSHPITILYSGDQNYAAGTSTLTQATDTRTSTTTLVLTTPATLTAGQTITVGTTFSVLLNGEISSVSYGGYGGTISYYLAPQSQGAYLDNEAVLLATTPVNTSSSAGLNSLIFTSSQQLTLPTNAHGKIVALYTGWVPSFGVEYPGISVSLGSSVGASTAVLANPSSVTLATTPNPVAVNTGVKLTATIPIQGVTGPTGSVTFYDTITGSRVYFTSAAVNSATGVATAYNIYGVTGTHPMVAVYAGDSNYATSTSNVVNEVVYSGAPPAPAADTTTLTSSVNPAVLGQSVTFTAVVAPTSTGATPVGTVTFSDTISGTPVTLGTGTLDPTGTTTLSTSTLIVGTHPVTASYGGSTTYAASASTPLSQVITAVAVPVIPNQPVHTPSIPINIPIYFPTSTPVATIAILTDGTPNQDFTLGSTPGNCTAQTYAPGSNCSINIVFTPYYPGLRHGAIVLYDSSHNVLQVIYISGTGIAPMIGFIPGVPSISPLGTSLGSSTSTPVVIDANQNIYYHANDTKTLYSYTSTGSSAFTLGDNTSVSSNFTSAAIDGAGNVYLVGNGTADARVYNVNSHNTTTLTQVLGVAVNPTAVTVDANGNAYFIASSNTNIYTRTALGVVTSIAITGVTLQQPSSIAVAPNGTLYVSDLTGNQVVAVNPVTGAATVVSTGSYTLNGPRTVKVDALANLYITDAGNARILEVSHNATISVASSPIAKLIAPSDVAVDQTGNIFVVDVAASGTILYKIDIADPPSVAFTDTNIGTTSTDSPRTVTVENLGNAALTFSSLAIDIGDTSFTNPSVSTSCSSTTTLADSATCILTPSFAPSAIGPQTGTITLLDNSLNQSPATQIVNLSGNGLNANTPILIFPPAGPITYGANLTGILAATSATPGVITYTAKYPDGTVVTVTNPSLLPPGTYVLTATLTPTNTSLPTVSKTITLVVNPATPIISATPATFVYGAGGSMPVTIAGVTNGANPTGTFTYTINGVTYTGTLVNGAAVMTIPTNLPVGPYTISIHYPGDANYASTNQTVVVTITQATPTLTFPPSPPILTGTPLAPVLVATGSVPGTITYTAKYPNGTTVTVTSVSQLPPGTYTITATLTPTDTVNYKPISTSITLVVNPITLTLTAANATKVYGTANPTFTGTLTGQLPGDTFTESFSTTATVSSSAGSYAIVPAAAGANLANYTVAATNGTLTISKAADTLVLTPSSATPTLNATTTFTATLTSATTGTPTGTVSFYDGPTLLGTGTITNGVATFQTATLTTGNHSITAQYGGDINFTSSTGATAVSLITPDFFLTVNKPALTIQQGQTAQLVFTFTPVGGFKGNVVFACQNLPSYATCVFTPPSLTADGSNLVQTTQLQMITVGNASGIISQVRTHGGSPTLAGLILFPAFALGGLLAFQRKRFRLGGQRLLLLLLLFAGFNAFVGCACLTNTSTGSVVVTASATASANSSQAASGQVKTAGVTITITQ